MDEQTQNNIEQPIEVEVETKSILSQKQAVKQFLKEALDNKGITMAEGDAMKSYISKEMRKEVAQRLFNGMRDGSIALSSQKDDKALRKYSSGLISNWLKKDKDLN